MKMDVQAHAMLKEDSNVQVAQELRKILVQRSVEMGKTWASLIAMMET